MIRTTLIFITLGLATFVSANAMAGVIQARDAGATLSRDQSTILSGPVPDPRIRSHPAIDQVDWNWDGFSDAMVSFAKWIAPDAIEKQNRRWGLFIPDHINPNKDLVVLLHGLDGDASCCETIVNLMKKNGLQTAVFAYPGERPLAQTSRFFQQKFSQLRQKYPSLKVDLVTESMGGLIARDLVEGPDYPGGVNRLIMVAPPNLGSPWAGYSLLSKIDADLEQYRHDPEWRWTWMVNEGLWQAGDDLKPGSKFLTQLNARPRRAGIRYTIISGDKPIGYRYESVALAGLAKWIPHCISDWWGIRQAKAHLEKKSARALEMTGEGDGPVPLKSAALPGVNDFVTLHADHLSLFESIDDQLPMAWPVIQNRLESRQNEEK